MSPYSTAGWESFFVAEVGAAAALTGLLFVAVSINLSKILAFSQLPGRAAESLLMLVGVLMVSSFCLVPGQPRMVLGGEILVASLTVWIYPMAMQRRTPLPPDAPRLWLVTRVLTHQIGALPLVVAGVSMLAGVGGGLYWLVAGTMLSFTGSILNAWVLLVEILR
jgi:modulator of FtsH protease